MSITDNSSLYTLEGEERDDTLTEYTFIQPWRQSQSHRKSQGVAKPKRESRVYDMPVIKERYIPHTSAEEYLLMGASEEEGVDVQVEFERLVKDLADVFAARISLIEEINSEH
jgi:hypothetical protein